MANPVATDAEMKTRIITHMNRDHTRELGHYLRHYAKLSSGAASASPILKDISLTSMTITTSSGSSHTIPFSPPLSSWAEVRARVVAMDATARDSLGISDIYLTEYAPPQGFDCIVFGGVFFYFTCLASLPLVVPGTTVWSLLGEVFPGGPEWFTWIVKAIAVPVIAIHITEVIYFDRWRMQRHGVQRWSALWWKWSLSCFFEGITAWRRSARVVEEKRRQKEAKKH